MTIEPRARLRELEKRLKDEPENLGLRVTVAGLLREAGRGGEAVELYRSVAIAYRDQGRTQQAIAVCRSILEVEPQDAACQELLASLVAGQPAAGPTATLSGVQPARASVKTPTAPHPVPPRLPTEPTKSARTPTGPPPPRPPTEPTQTVVEAPTRRSSFEATPLPKPLPYHVADPTTSSAKRISNPELSTAEILPTRAGSESEPVTFSEDEPRPRGKSEPSVVDSSGIASAARRITALVGAASDDEVETREIARLEPLEPEKPPTIPTDRVELYDDDAPTPPPRDDDERTYPRDLPIGIAAGSGVSPLRPAATKPPPPPKPSGAPPLPELTNAFFEAVPAKQRTTVLTRFVRRTVKAGIAIIRQGETSHPLVVVVKGALDVIVERADGTIVKLGTIGEGDFIGEGALLAHSPAPAQVVVAADAELLLLSARELYEIAGAFPSLWSALKDRAEKRTRELDAKFKS